MSLPPPAGMSPAVCVCVPATPLAHSTRTLGVWSVVLTGHGQVPFLTGLSGPKLATLVCVWGGGGVVPLFKPVTCIHHSVTAGLRHALPGELLLCSGEGCPGLVPLAMDAAAQCL
ncbi:unnamed protein product [Natator depressus]